MISLDGFSGVVKVTLDPKPTIREVEFKDYIKLRAQKKPEEFLGQQKRELYF